MNTAPHAVPGQALGAFAAIALLCVVACAWALLVRWAESRATRRQRPPPKNGKRALRHGGLLAFGGLVAGLIIAACDGPSLSALSAPPAPSSLSGAGPSTLAPIMTNRRPPPCMAIEGRTCDGKLMRGHVVQVSNVP